MHISVPVQMDASSASSLQQQGGLADHELLRERQQIEAWQSRGDRAALQGVLLAATPRLRAMARRMSRDHADDLLAEGLLSLVDAARRYRPEGTLPFMSYGAVVARGAMQEAHARLRLAVSMPSRRARDQLSGRLSGASDEGSPFQVEAFDEDGCGLSQPASEENLLQRERRQTSRRAVAEALRQLDRVERRLVVHHLLQQQGDLALIAQDLGISVTRARALESRALLRMRNTLLRKGYGIRDLT